MKCKIVIISVLACSVFLTQGEAPALVDSLVHFNEKVTDTNVSEHTKMMVSQTRDIATQTVEGLGENRDSVGFTKQWLGWGIQAAKFLYDGAYQFYKSNRFFGEESGTCQSWTTLKALPEIKKGWKTQKIGHAEILVSQHNASVISLGPCDSMLMKGSEAYALQNLLMEAKKIRNRTDAEKVYLPLNFMLTNKVSGSQIMHRTAVEVVYDKNGAVRTLTVVDPQTSLSGKYLSNAQELVLEAAAALKADGFKGSIEYTAANIQLPGTGNCQKLAAYAAVRMSESGSVADLSMGDANSFCTRLHEANQTKAESAKPASEGFLSRWLPKLW